MVNKSKFSCFLFIESCEDFSADDEDCTKFVRCFSNLRIRFTCPPGTAWEDSLKTCVWIEQVESCNEIKERRSLGNSFLCFLIFSFNNDYVENIKINRTNDTIIYEADANALNDVLVGRTLAEARALGPIVTSKRFRCTFCSTGYCGVVINTIQCFCGAVICPPSTTRITTRATSINVSLKTKKYIVTFIFSSTTKSL